MTKRYLDVKIALEIVGYIEIEEGESVEDYLYEMGLPMPERFRLADEGFHVVSVIENNKEINWEDSKTN